MKANEAPEKIWMSNDTEAIWVTNPSSTRFIEYTRTDVFIEKACEWLECNLSDRTDIEFWIEDFVTFMKGD